VPVIRICAARGLLTRRDGKYQGHTVTLDRYATASSGGRASLAHV
jgi:hypothetical protein